MMLAQLPLDLLSLSSLSHVDVLKVHSPPFSHAEFDLDDGALSPTSSTSTLQANQSDGPLFVGLLSAGRRRELSFDLPNGGRAPARPEEDAGEMPEWLSKGGGMVSGIANM